MDAKCVFADKKFYVLKVFSKDEEVFLMGLIEKNYIHVHIIRRSVMIVVELIWIHLKKTKYIRRPQKDSFLSF